MHHGSYIDGKVNTE